MLRQQPLTESWRPAKEAVIIPSLRGQSRRPGELGCMPIPDPMSASSEALGGWTHRAGGGCWGDTVRARGRQKTQGRQPIVPRDRSWSQDSTHTPAVKPSLGPSLRVSSEGPTQRGWNTPPSSRLPAFPSHRTPFEKRPRLFCRLQMLCAPQGLRNTSPPPSLESRQE